MILKTNEILNVSIVISNSQLPLNPNANTKLLSSKTKYISDERFLFREKVPDSLSQKVTSYLKIL